VQKIVLKSDVAVIKLRLPVLRIPLVYDCTSSSLSTLVDMLEMLYGLLAAKKASSMEKIMLLSILGITITNVSIYSRGLSDTSSACIMSEPVKERLKLIVMTLIEKPQSDDAGLEISRSALRLFITGIEVLFPTEGERCTLLIRYLENFNSGKLNELEKSVLESLIRRMTNIHFLSKLCSKSGIALNPNDLLKSLLMITKRALSVQFGAISLGTYSGTAVGGFVDAAMQMLVMYSNVMMSSRSQYLMASETEPPNYKLVVEEIIFHSKTITETCVEILETAVELNSKIGVSVDSRYIMNPVIEDVLCRSPVFELLPLLSDCLFMLSDNFGIYFNQPVFLTFTESIRSCLGAIQKFLFVAPKKFLFPPAVYRKRHESEYIYESEHPYLPNTDHYSQIHFPGAKKITISFSPQSRTETSLDYVAFYKNSRHDETWHGGVNFSGADGDENWPGVGGRPPLVIEGDSFDLYFRSDGSNQDWGWKFIARVEYKHSFSSAEIHWLLDLEQRLVNMLSGYASSFVLSYVRADEQEESVSIWLNAGFHKKEDIFVGSVTSSLDAEANKLLLSLMSPTKDPLSTELCKIMKENVPEDRGNVDLVDLAVRGTCALLIKVRLRY